MVPLRLTHAMGMKGFPPVQLDTGYLVSEGRGRRQRDGMHFLTL